MAPRDDSGSGCGWILLVIAAFGLCLIPFVGLPIALVLVFGVLVTRLVGTKLVKSAESPRDGDAGAESVAEAESSEDEEQEKRDDGIASPS